MPRLEMPVPTLDVTKRESTSRYPKMSTTSSSGSALIEPERFGCGLVMAEAMSGSSST